MAVALTLAGNSGELARPGYAFAGWNTAADGSGASYAAGGTYTANAPLALYARWTVLGDLNGDGVVNVVDLALVTGHFGQSTESPAWDPRADPNDDGVVNVLDLAIVIATFGWSAP